jgi:hypothetical protein
MTRSSCFGCAVALVVASCGSRGEDDDAPRPVVFSVGVDTHPGIEVRVDGVALPAGQDGFGAQYDDYAAARESPLFHVETWKAGALVDEIDIGFGACERHCAEPEVGCEAELVVNEQVGAFFDESAVFYEASDDPRAWRGAGCMWCQFSDGVNFAECT